MIRSVLLLSLLFSAFSAQAGSLSRRPKAALCEHVVYRVLLLGKEKLSVCRKNMRTKVLETIKDKVGKTEFLTGLETEFELMFADGKEDITVAGRVRLVYELTTSDEGELSGKWRVVADSMELFEKAVGEETIIGEYELLLYEGDLEAALASGDVRKATKKEAGDIEDEFDFWDVFPDFSHPEEAPDMIVEDYEETLYVFDKDGVLLPFALSATWRWGSTEWDDLELSEEDGFWLADSRFLDKK